MASTMDRPRPCPSWWWATPGIEALEWMEKPVDFAGWDDLAGVGDREHRRAVGGVGGVGGDVNVPAGNVVADCVVDEVNGETLEESGVADQGRGGWRC